MKLGGSVLTDKTTYRTPRPEHIQRLAQEIAAAGERTVIVHGAGSYGHVLARTHGLIKGDDGTTTRRLAASRVHSDVRALQGLLMDALRDAGIPAFGLSALDLARLRAGTLTSFAYEPLHETLARGMTPVIGGDVVLDDARGFGILSGDVLMVEIARSLHPARAIFVTDVDGIYDRAPTEKDAKLIARVDATHAIDGHATRVPDITGSMAGKLVRAREVARVGVPVGVVNGLVPGRLQDALSGKPVVGTLIE